MLKTKCCNIFKLLLIISEIKECRRMMKVMQGTSLSINLYKYYINCMYVHVCLAKAYEYY